MDFNWSKLRCWCKKGNNWARSSICHPHIIHMSSRSEIHSTRHTVDLHRSSMNLSKFPSLRNRTRVHWPSFGPSTQFASSEEIAWRQECHRNATGMPFVSAKQNCQTVQPMSLDVKESSWCFNQYCILRQSHLTNGRKILSRMAHLQADNFPSHLSCSRFSLCASYLIWIKLPARGC